MDTIILKTKNRKETRLIQQLADKMGIENKSLSEEEMENIGMAILMSEVDRTKYASREEVMKALDAE
jgi:inosine/xanthosine triphosphate pyrophosphatase family protein